MFESPHLYLDSFVFMLFALLGLACSFLGSRLLRFWLAITGLLAGFIIGLSLGGRVLPDTVYPLVFGLLIGVLLAALLSIFPRFGTTLAGGFSVVLLVYLLLRLIPVDVSSYLLYILIAAMFLGMIFGVLQVKRFLALASAFGGGFLTSLCVGGVLTDWKASEINQIVEELSGGGLALILVGTIVLTIGGTLLQSWLLKRRQATVTASQPKIQPGSLTEPVTLESTNPLELNLVEDDLDVGAADEKPQDLALEDAQESDSKSDEGAESEADPKQK